MKRLTSFFVVALALSACETVSEQRETSPAEREVAFTCTNGESLAVRFLVDQQTAVLLRLGDAIRLQQQPSGSGFIYSNGPNTIRGKGDDLTVEIGRRAPIQCKAR